MKISHFNKSNPRKIEITHNSKFPTAAKRLYKTYHSKRRASIIYWKLGDAIGVWNFKTEFTIWWGGLKACLILGNYEVLHMRRVNWKAYSISIVLSSGITPFAFEEHCRGKLNFTLNSFNNKRLHFAIRYHCTNRDCTILLVFAFGLDRLENMPPS